MSCKDIRKNFIHIDMIDKLSHKYTNDFNKDRKYIRDKVVDLFKQEKAGQGKGKLSTRVIYCVEKIGDKIIYLKRPAPLNKGFDFEVHINQKLFFGKIKTRPSHNCIITILKNLKSNNENIFYETQKLIDELYTCNEKNISFINYNIDTNINVEILLKSIKWLFIEQDMTYWSFSGRNMLYKALKSV